MRMRTGFVLTLLLVAGCARSETDWLAALSSPDPFERVMAVTALARTGRPDLLPRVLGGLDDPDAQVRAAAGAALARLGPAAATALLDGLRPDASARARERAAATLPLLGEAAALPLTEALLDGEHDTHAVMIALERLGPGAARPALVPLTTLLASPTETPERRALAAQGLRAVDPTDRDALLALIFAGRDGNKAVRDAALMAAVTGLLARQRLPDGLARAAAQAQMETLGTAALEPLSRALREATDDATEETPIAALASFGTQSLEPAFDFLNPRDPRHVMRAHRLVKALGPDCVPLLIVMLDSKSEQHKLLALSSIGAFGSGSASAVPRLLAMLDSQDSLERWGAGYALGLIGPQDDAQLERLLEAAGRGDNILRTQLAPGLVAALLERIDAQTARSTERRAQLASLLPDAGKALQAVVDEGGPHAATAAEIFAGRQP